MVYMAALKAKNAARWAAATPTRNFISVAKSLTAAKSIYIEVERYTSVPWFVIAVIHEREADQRWDANLSQGDPWNAVSVHKPIGRGPFNSWFEAAVDALIDCSPHAAKNDDWTIGGTLTLLEEYNGLGYAGKELPSPYIWSGTNQYIKGKYVRDGIYDPEKVDEQLGCAGLLMAMMKLDASIGFGAKIIPLPLPSPREPDVVVSTPKSTMGAVWAGIMDVLKGK